MRYRWQAIEKSKKRNGQQGTGEENGIQCGGYEIKESTLGKRHYFAGRPTPIIQSTNGFNSGGNAGSAAVTLCFVA
jgi:hypothetical protein